MASVPHKDACACAGRAPETRMRRKGAGPHLCPRPEGTAGSPGRGVKKPLQVDPILVPPKESRPRASTPRAPLPAGRSALRGPDGAPTLMASGPSPVSEGSHAEGHPVPHNTCTDKEAGAPAFWALGPRRSYEAADGVGGEGSRTDPAAHPLPGWGERAARRWECRGRGLPQSAGPAEGLRREGSVVWGSGPGAPGGGGERGGPEVNDPGDYLLGSLHTVSRLQSWLSKRQEPRVGEIRLAAPPTAPCLSMLAKACFPGQNPMPHPPPLGPNVPGGPVVPAPRPHPPGHPSPAEDHSMLSWRPLPSPSPWGQLPSHCPWVLGTPLSPWIRAPLCGQQDFLLLSAADQRGPDGDSCNLVIPSHASAGLGMTRFTSGHQSPGGPAWFTWGRRSSLGKALRPQRGRGEGALGPEGRAAVQGRQGWEGGTVWGWGSPPRPLRAAAWLLRAHSAWCECPP